MKTLYLLRHAKSSWHDPTLDDFDRPLNPRGMRAAPMIGEYMKEKGYVPDLVLCSSSRRTLETLSLIRPFIGVSIPTLVEDGLYLAPADTLALRAKEIEDTYDSALFIGHNPGMEDWAAMMTGEIVPPAEAPSPFPTAGLCVLQFDVPAWSGVERGRGRLTDFARPKDLDD